MNDEINIIIHSSIYIKAFAIILMLAAVALVFGLSTGIVLWWECFGVFIFLAQCALLFEFIDDRRKVQIPESEMPYSLRRQNDTGREK